jgi:hypothetical protein
MKARHISRFLVFALIVLSVQLSTLYAQDLSVSMNGSGEWFSRLEPLEFMLSRPLEGGERIALIIGTTDVTDLCTVHGDTLRYRPQAVSLPSGSVEVSLYLVTSNGEWSPAGSFTLKVLSSFGLEKNVITPSLTLTNKGQLAENRFPAPDPAPRKTFQELNGQMSLKVDLDRSNVALGVGLNAVGVSFKQEALRFSEKGEDAAKIDLASYFVELRTAKTVLSAGHISHGRHRHLLSGFASRGISAATAIGTFVDVSGSVLNGTNIVGWDNFIGLQNPKHRVYSGTLGVEILPESPGTIRVEASYAHGSQLPLNNFNQGQITDAEKSEGASLRLLLSDPSRAIRLDAGFAKARFTNPNDPLLAQGTEIVPVEATTRQARYAEVSWDVLSNARLSDELPVRMNVAFRHERVDPLYRVVGASVRADLLQNIYELQGGIGPLQVGVTHLRSEDNLAQIPSILTTKNRQTSANLVLSPASAPGVLPTWLPTISYGLSRTHQFGVSVPTNSDFTPERVPDQLTLTHTAGIDVQVSSVRVGYRGALTTQDNRQVGRENADAVSRTNGLNISFSPFAQLSVSLEGLLESNESTETGFITRGKRMGTSIAAQPLAGLNVSLNASLSTSKPDDGSSKQRQALFSLETSYAFDLSSFFVFNWRGQLFVRYSWSESTLRDNIFNLDTATRAWTVNTGVNFSIF